MEEKSVTVDGETFALTSPFFLIATQNPTEHAGAFPLPESQLDRFMMRIEMGYPQKNEEVEILRRGDIRNRIQELPSLISRSELLDFQKDVDAVHSSDAILNYVQALLQTTRTSSLFKTGLSPRCGLLLLQAAKAWAFLENRTLVLPEDVKAVAKSVMHHRLQNTQTRQKMQGLIEELIKNTPVPV
jgi:MoxR-like ATPase